jgi:ubiquinone/menaquinone biosynthesis C-methylase UbiE
MKDYLKLEVDTKDSNLISVIDDLPLWSAPFGLRLLDILELKRNINALDLGCGLGFPLIEVSQRLGQTSQVYGIDPWDEALVRVRLKLQVYNIKNVKLVSGFAEDMPFENEYFELIISNNGINNVQDLAQTLKECYRVCKANAQMVFTLNTEETMIEFYLVFQEVLKEEGFEDEIQKMKKHIYSKRKPIEEIKALTVNSGFKIKNIIHDSFELRFIDGTAMLNHYLIKYWFLDSWKEILNKNDLVRVFDKVESILNEQAEINGRVTLTIPFVTFDCRRK